MPIHNSPATFVHPVAMEQTPEKRAHLVTTLFDSLADSPELLGEVQDSMVSTIVKKLRDTSKVLKQENVLRKLENENTWNTANKTFDSVIERVITNTTDIVTLKRKVDELYEKGARYANADVGTHTGSFALTACCRVVRSRCQEVRFRWRRQRHRA